MYTFPSSIGKHPINVLLFLLSQVINVIKTNMKVELFWNLEIVNLPQLAVQLLSISCKWRLWRVNHTAILIYIWFTKLHSLDEVFSSAGFKFWVRCTACWLDKHKFLNWHLKLISLWLCKKGTKWKVRSFITQPWPCKVL